MVLLSVFVFFVEIIIPQGTNTLFIYFLLTDYFFTPTGCATCVRYTLFPNICFFTPIYLFHVSQIFPFTYAKKAANNRAGLLSQCNLLKQLLCYKFKYIHPISRMQLSQNFRLFLCSNMYINLSCFY